MGCVGGDWITEWGTGSEDQSPLGYLYIPENKYAGAFLYAFLPSVTMAPSFESAMFSFTCTSSRVPAWETAFGVFQSSPVRRALQSWLPENSLSCGSHQQRGAEDRSSPPEPDRSGQNAELSDIGQVP